MKKCFNCGFITQDSSHFCDNCGTRLVQSKAPKKSGVWANIGKIALYVALFFAVQIAISLVVGFIIGIYAGILYIDDPTATDKAMEMFYSSVSLVSLVSNVIFVLGICIFFAVRKKNILNEVNLKKCPVWTLPLCAVFGYCVNPVLSILMGLIPWPDFLIEYFNSNTESLTDGSVVLSIISIAVVTGFAEEFLFRGIVMTRLRRSFGVVVTSLLSAFLFAAVHLNPISFVAIFLLALFLAALFFKYDSIIPGIIVHTFFNLFAILGFPSENTVFLLGFVSVCIALSLGCGYLLLRKTDNADTRIEENSTVIVENSTVIQ